MLFDLALKSLLARRVTVGLTLVSITISVFVLLAIHHIRHEAQTNFTKTVSGVDLIVGARTGPLNLLLYSVFRIGNATNNIAWDSYQALAGQKEVAWTIPISLGDSHKGFRVMGTSASYFEHYSFGAQNRLAFASGQPFAGTYEAVLGAQVAKQLGYQLGDKIVLAHGTGSTSFSEHSDHPFAVSGILKTTGTPVDQTIHVRLAGIEAIHKGWQSGVDLSRYQKSSPTAGEALTPQNITAFMVGLDSKLATFSFQRKVNQYKDEALLAILPGVALAQLWQMMGTVEGILLLISWLVLVAALMGMGTMMLAAMRERRQEFAVLRAVGASPWFILLLLQLEVMVTTLLSIGLAIVTLWLVLSLLQDVLAAEFGLGVSTMILTADALLPMLLVIVAANIVGLVPAFAAYRVSQG